MRHLTNCCQKNPILKFKQGDIDVKVYIWGTGKIAAIYMGMGELEAKDICGFIETKKQNNNYMGKPVYEPAEITKCEYDYILVLVNDYTRDIYSVAKENGLNVDKMVFIDNWEWFDSTSIRSNSPKVLIKEIVEGMDYDDIKKKFPRLYMRFMDDYRCKAMSCIPSQKNAFDILDKNQIVLRNEFNTSDYQEDYFRYRTFELVANEILNQQIEGNVAELGVFRGTFSKVINKKFYMKKCYLFDTFESFNEEEYQKEFMEGHFEEGWGENFKNTSDEYVLSQMPYPGQCEIRKGFFPDTVSGLEQETYCFVSIDVDFEQSILEGCRYFYPRLVKGGVIFVHDYNNRYLEGVKKAIQTYEEEIGNILMKVPIADQGGTLIIYKG